MLISVKLLKKSIMNLLLKKLPVYGASPDSVAWVRSYLEGRQQFVKLGHITSEPKPVRQGVPQGSIRGPVLFLLFVNDMPLHLNLTPPLI